MTDLHTRFQSLDAVRAPDLWSEVEERAMAMQPTPRRSAWVLIAVTLVLVLVIGGAVLVGSGIVKLPITVDASAAPSSSAHESAAASSSSVVQVPASWTATGNMLEARTGHTATQLLDGRVLLAGGGADLVSAELYDPASGTWTITGSLIDARSAFTATLLPDGKVLVAGGYIISGGPDPSTGVGGAEVFPVASAELYDPVSGTWTATGSMIDARAAFTATLLHDGRVLVAGGAGATAELYDLGTGTWSAAGEMLEVRSGHTATLLLDGRVVVAGSGTTGASAELYDPISDSWTATGTMLEGRINHTATLLLDGRVLVAGSMNGTGASASAELYDPHTAQWTATGTMLGARLYHTATLLPGGKVLVAGGTDSVIDGGQPSASAELYDPSSGQWTATASMIEAHVSHTATLLGDGTALVTGGSGGGVEPLASAELYDPGSGS
jgi:hypothetical protein